MDSVQKIILAATSVASLIPAASLAGGLTELPPDFSDFVTFTSGAIGPALVLGMYLMRRRIEELKPLHGGIIIIISFALGLALSGLTYVKTQTQIGEIPYYTEVDGKEVVETTLYIKPEELSPTLDAIVNGKFKGAWDDALIDNRDGPQVAEMIKTQSLPTQIRMIAYFNLAQIFLIIGFMALALKATSTPSAEGGTT